MCGLSHWEVSLEQRTEWTADGVTLTLDTKLPPPPRPPSCKKHVCDKGAWVEGRRQVKRERGGGGGRGGRGGRVLWTDCPRREHQTGRAADSPLSVRNCCVGHFYASSTSCCVSISFGRQGCPRSSDHDTTRVTDRTRLGGNQQWFSKQELNQWCSGARNTCQSKPITFKQPSSISTPLGWPSRCRPERLARGQPQPGEVITSTRRNPFFFFFFLYLLQCGKDTGNVYIWVQCKLCSLLCVLACLIFFLPLLK